MSLDNLRQIKIGDKWSYSDFGLFLSSGWTLSGSAPKTTYVDVPEADGQLDMSEALSGEIHYQSRNFSASLIFQDDTQANWELKRRQLANYAHGRKLKLQLPDTPDYYLQGRFSVGPLKTDYPFATVDVTAVLDPWLYKNDLTVYSRPAIPPVQNADGSYNHVAYAYSADGTDGFTTVYPNLNLLTGTKNFSNIKTNQDTSFTLDEMLSDPVTQNNVIHVKTTGYVSSGKYLPLSNHNITSNTINIGAVITVSIKAKGTGNFNWGLETSNEQNITLTGDYVTYSYTTTLQSYNGAFVFYSANTVGGEFWTKDWKVELNSVATPWMPSASEVQPSDWPSYIGTYVDNLQTGSNDPEKYLWKPYLPLLPVGGSIALVLPSERKTAVPSITTNQPLSITEGNLSENIGVGTFQLSDFALSQGDNSLTFTNKGTAVAAFSISYQEASL